MGAKKHVWAGSNRRTCLRRAVLYPLSYRRVLHAFQKGSISLECISYGNTNSGKSKEII